jgi:hypothetical protein
MLRRLALRIFALGVGLACILVYIRQLLLITIYGPIVSYAPFGESLIEIPVLIVAALVVVWLFIRDFHADLAREPIH